MGGESLFCRAMAEGCCQGAARVSREPRAGREDKGTTHLHCRRAVLLASPNRKPPAWPPEKVKAPGTWQTAGLKLLSLDLENPTIPLRGRGRG
jgi:hypothetical protein